MIETTLMMTGPSNDDLTLVYTYFPYTKFHCHQSFPILINQYKKHIGWVRNTTRFPKKQTNFYGCPLKVAFFHVAPFIMIDQTKDGFEKISGIEANLLRTMAKIFNFQIEPVIVQEWGFAPKNHTNATGAIQAVSNKMT